MADKDLRLDPHSIAGDCWWYEEEAGITVVVEHQDRHGTSQYVIPWRRLQRALERKNK